MLKKEKSEEITLKNTKQEILDALNASLEREKNANSIKYEPEKEETKRKKEEAVIKTRENVENNVFSEELVKKFKDLEIALEAEEEKLNTLYGVEKELANMVVVVNASKEAIMSINAIKDEKEQEYKDRMLELENTYEAKKRELEEGYTLLSKNLKLAHDRENEEYNYNLKREREIDKNKWEDEKAKREKELAIKEEETMRLLDEANSKKAYLEDLESKIASLPTELENEYNRGFSDASCELEKENKYQTELLKKDYQNLIDRQKDKIASLESDIENYKTVNQTLQEKLDKSYAEIKDMAARTVEANGSVKFLGGNQNETKM